MKKSLKANKRTPRLAVNRPAPRKPRKTRSTPKR